MTDTRPMDREGVEAKVREELTARSRAGEGGEYGAYGDVSCTNDACRPHMVDCTASEGLHSPRAAREHNHRYTLRGGRVHEAVIIAKCAECRVKPETAPPKPKRSKKAQTKKATE